jgi:hypothetical protein
MEAAGPSEMLVPVYQATRRHILEGRFFTCKQTLHIFRSPNIRCRVLNNMLLPSVIVGRIAQSVYRLGTGWTVLGSNPGGGEIFRTCPDRSTQPPVQWVPSLSRG